MPQTKSAPREEKLAPGALKLKPAAEYLGGLSVPTMHRLIQRGLLKPCRATRHLLFPKKELDRFLMT
jgi:excisionase family DNA binding protein